jgi:hypothetical protein
MANTPAGYVNEPAVLLLNARASVLFALTRAFSSVTSVTSANCGEIVMISPICRPLTGNVCSTVVVAFVAAGVRETVRMKLL